MVATLQKTVSTAQFKSEVELEDVWRIRLFAMIPTRRVSEGFCRIVRPSLTRRVVMFPLSATILLKQQAASPGCRLQQSN